MSATYSEELNTSKKMVIILATIIPIVALLITICGCTGQSNIKTRLGDLYYIEFYMWAGKTFDILVAEVAIENTGVQELAINRSYVVDDGGIDYQGLLLYEDWTKTFCRCAGSSIRYDKIEQILPEDKIDGYFMSFKEVPRNVTGLKLIIETNSESVILQLGNGEAIRRIELPDS